MKQAWKKVACLFLAAVIAVVLLPVGAAHAEETAGVSAGKVFSVMGDSISTFAGYIPVADGFNREHLPRYPQDDLLTDVNETWWMQVVAELDGKLGINDSWRGATVSGGHPVTTGDTGENAAMSNLTRIKNLGSNGTPDVIMLYGGTNDLAHVEKVGAFDPNTAPTQVNLTITKWDNLVEAYAHTLLRMRHYYPDAVILAMLPTYTKSYYSDEKLAQANAELAKVCEHYGVPYVDLRDSGVKAEHLPDGIHPGEEGMDLITAAVVEALENQCTFTPEENVVYKVSHNLSNTTATLGHYKGISAGKPFTETFSGSDLSVKVIMGGVDITESCYTDREIYIPAVTGDLEITAEASFTLGGRLQQLPDMYYGINLWQLLSHGADYYAANGWTVHATGQVKSVAVPVKAGEKIYASSFEAASANGSGSTNGIRVTWFTGDGVANSISADAVYKEFQKNGCLTVPAGAAAVCIPMWTDSADWVLTITAEGTPDPKHDYVDGYCTQCQNVTAGQQHFATITDALDAGYLWMNRDLTEDVVVSKDTYLDLNSYTLKGDITVADGATLYIFDSATADYTANHRGKFIGTVTGNLARSFNTPAAYGHNYKYLALKESDESYSFHRYYLAVKSVVLSPRDTGVNYRTVFKCNGVVAQHVEDYGIRLKDKDYSYGDYAVVAGGDENSKLARVNEILDADAMNDLAAAQERAETEIPAAAIITLNDGWSEDGLTVSSTTVSRSLVQQIAYANGKYGELTGKQQAALLAMYNQYADLMLGWDMDVIGNIRLAANPVNPASHCVCGANVAEAHIGGCTGKVLTWTAWNSTNTLPTDNGNYYLTADVTLEKVEGFSTDGTWRLNEKNMDSSDIKLDLNGKTIKAPKGKRVMTVYRLGNSDANIVFTDSSAGHCGKIVNGNTSCDEASMFYLISSGGERKVSVSVYRTVLDASNVNYVGFNGGAIRVDTGHTLNLYGVTMMGCTTNFGSAIYSYGGTTQIADGSTVIGKKANKNGGAIYMHSGIVNLTDSTVNGGAAANGGAIAIISGSLTMTDSTVNGGDVSSFGGAVWMGGPNAFATMNGGLIKGANATGGGAVNIADGGGSFTMKASAKGEPVIDAAGCSAGNYGAAVHVSGNGGVNSSFTMECGEIKGGNVTGNSGGGAVFVQGAKAVFTMNGGTISGGKLSMAGATKGGGNIRINGTGATFVMNGGTITGGETANGRGGGVYVGAGTNFRISGNARITGNVGNDLYLESAASITIGANWVGDAGKPMVVSMAAGTGTIATAAGGITLTEAQKAYIAGNVSLTGNAFVLN